MGQIAFDAEDDLLLQVKSQGTPAHEIELLLDGQGADDQIDRNGELPDDKERLHQGSPGSGGQLSLEDGHGLEGRQDKSRIKPRPQADGDKQSGQGGKHGRLGQPGQGQFRARHPVEGEKQAVGQAEGKTEGQESDQKRLS